MVLAVLAGAANCNSSCSSNCRFCSSADTCTNCCWNFGIKSYLTVRTINAVNTNLTVAECEQCFDSQCNSCSFDSLGT